MSYRLYLDDIRTPKTEEPWVIVRDYASFCSVIFQFGFPNYISFDHDLGQEKTGYDCAKVLQLIIEQEKMAIPKDFDFNVHSANPIGAKNIECFMNNLIKYYGEK